MTAELLARFFLPAFSNPILDQLNDQAVFDVHGIRLALTTDAFVVSPLFFPGGDIGCLAVNGTINDLAMCGAMPLALSAAFILEEGLPFDDLQRVITSMADACRTAGVQLVTGDTKVVERGKGDGLFITTTGIGIVTHSLTISADRAQPGDCLLVSGPIGDHGIAVLSAREGLEFETTLVSDTAPLHTLVQAMMAVSPDIHCLRDPTRGGLASTLNELAISSRVGMRFDENRLPIRDEVRAACELLGLDPLYVACEGRLVAIVGARDADAVLACMHAHPCGAEARMIGEVVAVHPGMVTMRTVFGSERVVDMLAGAQLPRIC
ncbi:MAG: hydrogenase expression/formation protein HypE [Deltaproteobacteria bacterium]|nr:hydrogenase expression/formation protein HypE [Deltaproteobacteria bacterium]